MELVGHDLNPNRQQLRKPLPGVFKYVIYGTLGLFSAILVMTAVNVVQTTTYANATRKAELEQDRLDRESDRLDKTITDRSLNKEKARRVLDWAELGWHAQSFLVDAMATLPPTIELDELTCELKEGYPQMALTLKLRGSDFAQKQAREAFARSLFEKGILVSESDPTRISNGISTHKLLLSLGSAQAARSEKLVAGKDGRQ